MPNTQDKLPLKKQIKVVKRLLKQLKAYKKDIVIAFILIFVGVTFNLMSPLIQKIMVDDYILKNNFDIKMLSILIGLFVLSSATHTVLNYLGTIRFHKIGNKIVKTIRIELFEKLQTMGMRYFDQTPVGSIVSRVTNDTEAIQEMFSQVLSVLLVNLVLIVGILAMMFYLNATLAIICIIFLILAFSFVFIYQKVSTKYYQKAREKNSEINTRLSESISGMKIIQEFNQQKRMIKEFSDINEGYYGASVMNIKLDGLLLSPVIHVITSMALASMLYISGIEAIRDGTIMVGSIMAFIELIYRLFDPVFQIMDRLAIYQQAIVASDRVYTIMDHQEHTPQQDADASNLITNAKIEFKNVTFSYDGVNNVLKDISFVVNPGETLALVGHTGSGKSSIINVMMRFYEFFEGDILIDDVSIRSFPIEELRKKMGLVLQDPFIYYGTINDNIRLRNKSITDQAIKEACEFVQVDSFIQTLDGKYDFQVVEDGAAFSTGQKQLLAFARAIVVDPKILILDEATANIDTETEGLIQEGLERIRQGRTTLMIAHRLSTIKDANLIIVLDQGCIVEKGNHEELMKHQGLYYGMIQLQNSNMSID